MSKQFDPSPAADVLAARFGRRGKDAKKDVQAAVEKPATAKSSMTTRSWYISTATADELSAAAETIRHSVPAVSKHQALEALLRWAIEHKGDVAAALAADRKAQTGSSAPTS
ncbi:hypothetical protein CFN78_28215 [Amycolatopsis antarctica]|uniref:Uncharacterized protein n=1 Tax=Amycolatopsis antarctica TaxID=1854586 RepID=A0A263CUY1_9PSEU|nr:hypothetical protein [Amycolatopsis antarctica]OZM69911.1 hypothetical protein CFN78_28215 [Amycolatopsis antarctica]PXY51730.1 hypothetical protein CIT14_21740 [Virgibacillus profundi]